MKNILSKTGIYLIDFVAAMWVGILAVLLTITLYRLTAEPTILQDRIFWTILQTLGTVGWLFFSAWKIGYKQKRFTLPAVVIPAIVAFIVQALLVYPTHFAVYTAGPTNLLADAIYWGNREFYWERWVEVPLTLRFGLLIAFDILYLAAMIAGEYIGAKKRQKDRAELTANPPTNHY